MARPCGCEVDPWVFGHRHYGRYMYDGWPERISVMNVTMRRIRAGEVDNLDPARLRSLDAANESTIPRIGARIPDLYGGPDQSSGQTQVRTGGTAHA